VRLLVDLARDGIVLTPGGRLPRTVVRQVQEQRPHWAWSEKPAHVEDDLPPLCALHDLLRDTGLLRLRKGSLHPLRAAGDDLRVLRRLRAWFAGDRFTALLTDLTLARVCAAGPRTTEDIAGHILPMLGHRWTRGGQPLTTEDVAHSISGLNSTMRGLDLIDRDIRDITPGPSAHWLLPRATRLAHLWRSEDQISR
jgi:hypothetical protein